MATIAPKAPGTDRATKLDRPFTSTYELRGLGEGRTLGVFRAPEGLVVWTADRVADTTLYETVRDGRLHTRTEQTARTERGAAIQSGRWLRELAADTTSPEEG